MFDDKRRILQALTELGRRLALRDSRPVTLVICGAAALNCTDLLARQTRDVDVLGLLAASGSPKLLATGLPEELMTPIASVAADLGVEVDWLNDRSIILQTQPGLPPGFERRLLRPPLEFGPCLRVTFPSRLDMVALKFYAALDRRLEEAMRHYRDLVEMEPTHDELEFAAAWLVGRPTSEEFRRKVCDLAERFGAENLRALKEAATSSKPTRRSARRKKA
ncbi:MAG: nucleotidyl transferase AbiEii/AbiGii toxin family protein [Verrucomicrobia bacterium]|nr:nucleotidyl transferase AbiEii/AbiGii toxin family protein [Verrucomicrobiota bacterium]